MDCMIMKEKGIMRSFLEGGGGGDSRMLQKKEEEIQSLKITLTHVVKRNEMLEKKVRHLERKLAAEKQSKSKSKSKSKSRADDTTSHTIADADVDDSGSYKMLKDEDYLYLHSRNVEDPRDIREEAMTEMVKKAAARAVESTLSFAQIMASRIASKSRKKDGGDHMAFLEAVKGCEAAGPAIRWAAEEHKLWLSVGAYVCRKMFCGYEHEDFYMSGRLRSLLEPEEHRRECWQQYRELLVAASAAREEPDVEPSSRLLLLQSAMMMKPDTQFGRFCRKKYVELLTESVDDVHRALLMGTGDNDNTGFYTAAFVRMAYRVWLSHRLSFASASASAPARRPSVFWVEPGTEFSAASMVPAVPGLELASDAHTSSLVPSVAFPVSPGFRLGSGGPCLLPCSVYLDNMQLPSSSP